MDKQEKQYDISDGYIKLYRKFKENIFYKNSEAVHLWLHLLFSASFEDSVFYYKNTKIERKRGQLITGRKKLSLETGIGESTVFRLLKLFESEHQIEQQKTNKFTIITILSYDEYNKSEQQMNNKRTTKEQQMNNKRTTNEQQMNTSKELKELEEYNIVELLQYLNHKTGFHYKLVDANKKIILARLKEYSYEQLYKMIDYKCNEWLNNEKMKKYLKPNTLFRASNCANYIAQLEEDKPKSKSLAEILKEEGKI